MRRRCETADARSGLPLRPPPDPGAADQRGGQGDERPGKGRGQKAKHGAERKGRKRRPLAPPGNRSLFAPQPDRRAEARIVEKLAFQRGAASRKAEGGEADDGTGRRSEERRGGEEGGSRCRTRW